MRRLFTLKWLAFHVLALIALVACLRLGWWQWDRAKSHSGTMQNFGYALQWPLFAGFVAVLWGRSVRDVLRPSAPATGGGPKDATPATDPDPVVEAVTAPHLPTEEEDPEVAAYNRYLSSLYARDEQQRRDRQPRSRRPAGARGGKT